MNVGRVQMQRVLPLLLSVVVSGALLNAVCHTLRRAPCGGPGRETPPHWLLYEDPRTILSWLKLNTKVLAKAPHAPLKEKRGKPPMNDCLAIALM